MEIFQAAQERIRTAMVNETSIFEPLKFYCIISNEICTFIRWSTLASNCVLTDNRQYNLSPGFATSLWANSLWNINTAHLENESAYYADITWSILWENLSDSKLVHLNVCLPFLQKGNICDFLFASPDAVTLSQWGLLLKGKNLLLDISFRSWPQ